MDALAFFLYIIGCGLVGSVVLLLTRKHIHPRTRSMGILIFIMMLLIGIYVFIIIA